MSRKYRNNKLKRSFAGKAVQALDRSATKMRKHWIVSLLGFLLFMLATAGQFLYQVYKDRRERARQCAFAVVMRAESHGRGTLEVSSSDPRVSVKDIDLAIDIQVTNIGNTNNVIAAMFVVVRSGDRNIVLRSVTLQSPNYLITQHNGTAQYIDISNKCFDTLAHLKVLTPNDSVGGCAFFKGESDRDHGFIIDRIHIYILDAYGTLHFIVPQKVSEDQYNKFSEGSNNQSRGRERHSLETPTRLRTSANLRSPVRYHGVPEFGRTKKSTERTLDIVASKTPSRLLAK